MRALTGGCQCGAVRYTAQGEPRQSDLCECRMCQRATGAQMAAFAQFAAANVVWHDSPPKLFRSSSLADRGFCAECGTTLTYQYRPGGTVSITLASLDDPNAIRPQAHVGIEGRAGWLSDLLLMPGKPSEAAPPGFENRQFTAAEPAS